MISKSTITTRFFTDSVSKRRTIGQMVYIAQEDRLKLYFPGVTHKLEKKNQSPISKHGIYIVLHPNIPLNVPIFSGLQLSFRISKILSHVFTHPTYQVMFACCQYSLDDSLWREAVLASVFKSTDSTVRFF